jgi:hypothetical protein
MADPQQQPKPSGPLYVHEYLHEPGPYALPEPVEAEPAADAEPPARRRRPANTGRTARTLFSTGMTIVLTVALGASMTLANEPKKLLFSDSFDRPDAAEWGEAVDGLRWMNPTGTSGFAVASGKGVMTVSGRGRSHETTLNTDVRDVTMQFDFSLDKVTGGSGAKIMAVLRKSKAGSYRVRVRLGREGRVWLSVAKAQGQGTGTVIGQPVLIESWRYRAGQTVTVRAQAIKKDPTQLRVKVWPAGSTPPAAWQLVRNDTGADIGGTGRVGLRTMVTRHANNPTATVRFDDVSVNRAQDAEPVAVTPSVARKQPTQPAPAPQPPASQPTKPADTSPPEIIEIGTLEVAQTSATVSWTLDEPATGFVKYGATKAYDRQTKAETDYLQTHIQQLSDLDPGTEYHYAIVSEDPAGNRKVSRDLTFTTKGTAAVAPQPAPTPRPTATPAPTPRPTATPAPRPTATPSPASVVYVPDSIDATGARDASAALTTFVAGVPNGSTIVFKRNGVYRMDHGLRIKGKSDLVLDGNGATLSSNPNTARTDLDSLIHLAQRNDDIVIHDFHFDGNSPYPGVHGKWTEKVHAILIGGDNVEVYNVTAEAIPGDFVKLHESGTATVWSKNAHIHDATVKSVGRNCLTVIAGQDAVFERVNCGVVGYTVFDIEPNSSDQGARNIIFRNNTATSWSNSFVSGHGASGSSVNGVVISGNTVTKDSLLTVIEAPWGRKNITITNNSSPVAARGPVMRLGYIDGLTVRGNSQPLSSGELARIHNSTNVNYQP